MEASSSLEHVADGDWGQRKYLDMGRLGGWDECAVLAAQGEVTEPTV